MKFFSKTMKNVTAIWLCVNAAFFIGYSLSFIIGEKYLATIVPMLMSSAMIVSVLYGVFFVFNTVIYFARRSSRKAPPLPSWEETVELLYDKNLESFVDEVVSVCYSKDKTKRIVIVRREDGLFTYAFEKIYQCDEYEWMISFCKDGLPGWWGDLDNAESVSLFNDMDELMTQMKAEPVYRYYFE